MKSVKVSELQAGKSYVAQYKDHFDPSKMRDEPFVFLGFTADEGDSLWSNLKEAYRCLDITNMKQAEECSLRIYGDWDGDIGAYYYLYSARFSRGSGADKIWFFEI